jgi:hypothetical protein
MSTWLEPDVASALAGVLFDRIDRAGQMASVDPIAVGESGELHIADVEYDEGERSIAVLLTDGRTVELVVRETGPVPRRADR